VSLEVFVFLNPSAGCQVMRLALAAVVNPELVMRTFATLLTLAHFLDQIDALKLCVRVFVAAFISHG